MILLHFNLRFIKHNVNWIRDSDLSVIVLLLLCLYMTLLIVIEDCVLCFSADGAVLSGACRPVSGFGPEGGPVLRGLQLFGHCAVDQGWTGLRHRRRPPGSVIHSTLSFFLSVFMCFSLFYSSYLVFHVFHSFPCLLVFYITFVPGRFSNCLTSFFLSVLFSFSLYTLSV